MNKNIRTMVLCSLFAALIAVCAWISLPVPPIAVTLQSFAVLLTLGVLGSRAGFLAVGLYLLMGVIGLPVFAGFRGCAAALLEPSGGFLWGFLIGAAVYLPSSRLGKLPAMILWQLTVYLCGCGWFAAYTGVSPAEAAIACVIPFLIPDGAKLWLAYTLSRRIGKHLPLQ